MLVTVTLKNIIDKQEYDNSFYTSRIIRVPPREQHAVPEEIMAKAIMQRLRAGYTITPTSTFYMSSAGNWVHVYHGTNKVLVGGHRKGIPWMYLGINFEDIVKWVYTGSLRPELHPMDSITNGTVDKAGPLISNASF